MPARVGRVDQLTAVGRPRRIRFALRRPRQPSRVAAVLRGGGKDLAAADKGDLLAVRRQRQLGESVCQRQVLDAGRHAARHAAYTCDARRGTCRRVESPDLEVVLECDQPAVLRHRRPQHASLLERRQLPRRGIASDGLHPQILRAALVRHVEQRLAVGAPHRPHLLRATRRHRFVGGQSSRRARDPDFRLVQVTAPVAPPLARRRGARSDRQRGAVGRFGEKYSLV